MKTLHWTTADAKRAEKMGWRIDWCHSCISREIKVAETSPFNSDDEAIEWVMSEADTGYLGGNVCQEVKTCRKAIALCCGAKKQ